MHSPRWVKLQHFGHAIVFSFPRKFISVDENVLIASCNSNASEIMKSGACCFTRLTKKTKAQETFPLVVHYFARGHIFWVIVCILSGNYSHQHIITAMGLHFAVGIGINHGPWGLAVCDWGKYAKNVCRNGSSCVVYFLFKKLLTTCVEILPPPPKSNSSKARLYWSR